MIYARKLNSLSSLIRFLSKTARGMRGSLVMLRLIRNVVIRILLALLRRSNFVATAATAAADDDSDDLGLLSEELPKHVKEGHFVVHTFNDGELKRFIIQLDHLAHPGFLKLLKQAKEEFGFKQAGVLAIHCGSYELQRTLENKIDGCNDVYST